jgi:ABC-type transport system involved in cytochrome bd biosynthesis fused ATPase/permease subunit
MFLLLPTSLPTFTVIVITHQFSVTSSADNVIKFTNKHLAHADNCSKVLVKPKSMRAVWKVRRLAAVRRCYAEGGITA